MLARKHLIAAVALAVAAATVTSSFAGRFNKKLSLGDPAPTWSGILGTDDEEHGLDRYKDAKAIVLIFTCNQCPVAAACEDRIIELQESYKDRGLQVVAVNVSNSEVESMQKMKERAQEKGYNFPYINDPTQQIARDYGARVTPDVILLDGQRNVAYMGAIDDAPLQPFDVKKNYLANAIDAVLTGSSPEVGETKAQGCSIEYERR